MNAALETAVIALGVNGLAATGAVVYAVRKYGPKPRPARQQNGTGTEPNGKTP